MRGVLKQVNISSLEHKILLTFEVTEDFEDAAEVCNKLYKEKCDLTVKKFARKRSRDANAYCWALCEELAKVIQAIKEEVYRQAIKEVGISRDIEILEDAAKTMQTAWKGNGVGWFSEIVDYGENDGFLLIRFYYGTSVYNSKQMARLIDHLVEECKEHHIETEPPEVLALMKEEWHGKVDT